MKLIAVVLFTFILSACVSNPPRQVVQPAKYDLLVNQRSSNEIFSDDVGISLKPIMLEKALSNDALFASYGYWNARNTNERGRAKTILVSLPVFEVQVTNTSGQAVSFQKAAIRLVDDAGNSYQAQLKEDIVKYTESQLDAMQNRGWAVDRAAALGEVKRLKLLDKNYESLPGIIEKRILSFDIGNPGDYKEYRKMFSNTKYVRVMVYNIPVKFDQAGNVTKVAKFDYLFDVIRKQ